MASEIVLPQWGMEMQDGTIVRWLKQEGDTVAEGEPIVEVETAKLQTELESTASGILSRIVAQEGQIVPIRGVLCVIAEPGEELEPPAVACRAAARAVRRAPTTAQAAPAANGAGTTGVRWSRQPVALPASAALTWAGCEAAAPMRPHPAGRRGSAALQAPAAPAEPPEGRVPVVPAARRLARENNIDLATVTGSGPQGRILIEDVEAAIAAQSAPAAAPGPAAGGVVPTYRHSRRCGDADAAEHPDHGAGDADHRGHRHRGDAVAAGTVATPRRGGGRQVSARCPWWSRPPPRR